MLLLSHLLCVAALVKSASTSEAISPDNYDDETSLLQLMHRQSTHEEIAMTTKAQDEDPKLRCQEAMGRAPRIIRRAMFRESHVNVCEMDVTDLNQDSFKDGTYIISTPGIYRLVEDVAMAPNTEHMMPPKDSETYPMNKGYWLGFVAAIAVATDNVFLDLNGKSLSMSPEFQMRQRFFSIVQLGERPFEAATGPPQFNRLQDAPFWASNVVINDGKLGMTSHAGVHGWKNSNIWIDNVKVSDFETAGIQLNGATDVYITNTKIGPSLGHADSIGRVPCLATLSQAQLLLRIVDGEEIEDEDEVFEKLRASVEHYISLKLEGGSGELQLTPSDPEHIFLNKNGLPDGSSLHGIVLHAAKPAIHDFASCPDFNGEEVGNFFGPVTLQNVQVQKLLLETDEVVSMQAPNAAGGITPIMGPAGDVLQVFRFRDDDGNYVGNVLSKAQLLLGRKKLEHEGDDADETFRLFGATHIPQPVIDWAAGTKEWGAMVEDAGVQFVCKKDAMTHFNKGVMGVRIEYYRDIKLDNVKVENSKNLGKASEISHCKGDDEVYSGNDVRGLTLSHVSGLTVDRVQIQGMDSAEGFAYGVEERTEVDYGGFHYDIDGITGKKGATNHDRGVNEMLESDAVDSDAVVFDVDSDAGKIKLEVKVEIPTSKP